MRYSERHAASSLQLSKEVESGLKWLPVVALIAWCVLAFNEATYPLVADGFRSAREYTAVEMGTAFAFVGAFGLGMVLCWRCARSGGPLQAILFLGFALLALLAALEETQWGQPILGYDIPAWMQEANAQEEFTLHNIEGPQGKAEIFYFVFCLGAAALYLPRIVIVPDRVWQDLRAHPALIPLVVCIGVTALLKLFQGIFAEESVAFDAVRWTTEITELYIAIWGLAYAAIKVFGPAPRSV
ncbi:hypothetical protein [Tranquillimonas rosea]|uniref:hypothetical protein n=1 Tax=Tranquillimonas rosea TaxID=641238 RepID=UPI003BAB45C5